MGARSLLDDICNDKPAVTVELLSVAYVVVVRYLTTLLPSIPRSSEQTSQGVELHASCLQFTSSVLTVGYYRVLRWCIAIQLLGYLVHHFYLNRTVPQHKPTSQCAMLRHTITATTVAVRLTYQVKDNCVLPIEYNNNLSYRTTTLPGKG